MANLHLTGAALQNQNEISIELSDGTTRVFSLDKLLAIVPDSVVAEEDLERTMLKWHLEVLCLLSN